MISLCIIGIEERSEIIRHVVYSNVTSYTGIANYAYFSRLALLLKAILVDLFPLHERFGDIRKRKYRTRLLWMMRIQCIFHGYVLQACLFSQ